MKVMVDPAFPDHRKVAALAERLDVNDAEAVGTLLLLWCRVMALAPSGKLDGWSDHYIARMCRWGGKPSKLVDALQGVGFLSGKPGAREVKDWTDWQGDVLKKREDWRRRKLVFKESRGNLNGFSKDSSGPSPSLPSPSLPIHTKEEGGGASAPPAPLPAPVDQAAPGLGQEVGAILHRNGVGLEEADHRPPSPKPSTQHLIGVARKITKMPNRTETLSTYLEAAAARYGADVVEQWLYDKANEGASVLVLADALEKRKAKADKLF